MPGKQPLFENEKTTGKSNDLRDEKTPQKSGLTSPSPAVNLQRAERGPQAVTPRNVQQLQRVVGNQVVNRLLTGAKPPRTSSIQRLYVAETAHYSLDRDEAHAKAKEALQAADSDQSISNKIFRKHKKAQHSGKCVTSFKASNGGFLVTVTYATLEKGQETLRYDTAFLSKTMASPPESSAITYNPDSPTISVS